MKKLLKIIPLLVMPIALSSCTIFSPKNNSEQQEAEKTTTFEITAESLSLGFGSSVNIGASLKVDEKPVDTEINWSTSNQSAVSLSKTKTTKADETVTLTAGSTEGSAVITAKTADGKYTKTCNVSVRDISGTTVFIYMSGNDLESGSDRPGYLNSGKVGLASMDLDEILSVNNQPSDVNIIVQTGGSKGWAKSNINKDKSQRWEIRNGAMNKISESSKVNMGLESTLQEFLTWGLQTYKSEKYGLIMWNHGGAMSGCCFDEQYSDDSISADELYNAVKNARSAAGISSKLEWITYDACLMAVQDVALYNSENFNYMLCSQESEAGYGYDYDAWLPSLYNNPGISGADLLPVIGRTFMEEEKALYQQWGEPFDQTQSVYDLSKMSSYKTAFENIATDLNSIIGTTSSKIQNLANLINGARGYGCDEDGTCSFEVRDVKEALNRIKNNSTFSSISSKVTTALNALNELVIYEDHGSATSGCGLCLYSPTYYAYPYSYGGTEYTKSNFTEWKKVSNKIFNEMYDPYY